MTLNAPLMVPRMLCAALLLLMLEGVRSLQNQGLNRRVLGAWRNGWFKSARGRIPAACPISRIARFPAFTALSLATNAQQQINIRFNLSNQQLLSGKTQDSLDTMEALERQLKDLGAKLPPDAAVELRVRKATAYLRLGNRKTVSQTIPPPPASFRSNPRAGTSSPWIAGAIPILNEQLMQFPEDLGARWLLNIAYMTLGEWPDKVPEAWVIPEGVRLRVRASPIHGRCGFRRPGCR